MAILVAGVAAMQPPLLTRHFLRQFQPPATKERVVPLFAIQLYPAGIHLPNAAYLR
jgi:hypothetical protein